MHRRSTVTMAALAPLWLLFLVLFFCVSLQAKNFDVAVGISGEQPSVASIKAR